MHMQEWLCRLGEEITAKPLPDFSGGDELEEWLAKRRPMFHKSLGIDRYLIGERTPLRVQKEGRIERGDYKIDKLYFESLPGLYVTGNLYLPKGLEQPAPGILYVCGHSPTQKVNYQEHARRFARLGFPVLILDTIEYGESRGIHHGTYRYGRFNWISRGYTPAAVEVWNAVRGLDLLSGLEEVDENRLGMTGTSGGGAITWWTAAADERVQAAAPSCGTGTTASHIREQTIDGHCDCMFPSNPYGWSLITTCALVAPRPLLIVSPDQDGIFKIDSVRRVYQRLEKLYEGVGSAEAIEFFEFPGPHSYSPESRQTIFSFFLRHLKDEKVSAKDVGDIDGVREEEETLLVFDGRLPAHDRTTNVQDWFIPEPECPQIGSPSELDEVRDRFCRTLLEESFAAFPEERPDPSTGIEQRFRDRSGDWGYKFTYSIGEDWRLWGELRASGKLSQPAPAIITPRLPGERMGRKAFEFTSGAAERRIAVQIDPRGTGRTAWGREMSWYLRRAMALAGRTIASLRVWDLLCGLKAVRDLPEVDGRKVALAGRAEMVVPVLYAALLDGEVDTVILADPPASHDIPGKADGTGPVLEIINSLRHGDLPQVAGLLWPTRIVFVGLRPSSYRWSEKLYSRLGEPGGIWRVQNLSELKDIL